MELTETAAYGTSTLQLFLTTPLIVLIHCKMLIVGGIVLSSSLLLLLTSGAVDRPSMCHHCQYTYLEKTIWKLSLL